RSASWNLLAGPGWSGATTYESTVSSVSTEVIQGRRPAVAPEDLRQRYLPSCSLLSSCVFPRSSTLPSPLTSMSVPLPFLTTSAAYTIVPSLRISVRSSSSFPPFASCLRAFCAAAGTSFMVTGVRLCPASFSAANARPSPPADKAPASSSVIVLCMKRSSFRASQLRDESVVFNLNVIQLHQRIGDRKSVV